MMQAYRSGRDELTPILYERPNFSDHKIPDLLWPEEARPWPFELFVRKIPDQSSLASCVKDIVFPSITTTDEIAKIRKVQDDFKTRIEGFTKHNF
jgi:hypothetical protein